MTSYQPLTIAFRNYATLNLRWKWLFAELVLEVLMVLAPANLDFLGAASEYLVDQGHGKIEFAIFQSIVTA